MRSDWMNTDNQEKRLIADIQLVFNDMTGSYKHKLQLPFKAARARFQIKRNCDKPKKKKN